MNTTTLDLGKPGLLAGRNAFDWIFAALLLLGAGYAWQRYGASMDGYERAILVGSVPTLVALGWFWRPLRALSLAVGATVLLAIALYQRQTDGFGADLAAAEQVFWLKYLLSSQSAILWMSTLFFMATLFYWMGFFARGDDNAALRIGSRLTWAAVFMALVGTFVRWFESHQIAPDIGHIPVSNLYEVFVLFAWMTALFYLYYEAHYQVRTLGGFVMLVISASVAFLLWYTVAREAHEIQPLVPALQSWWMKLHVPANFIGYGTFALAAMVALAYLLKTATPRALWTGLVWLPGAVLLAVLAGWVLGPAELAPALKKSATLLGGLIALFGLMVLARGTVNARSPSLELMDDVMYKAIAVGFAFFTIATVLGAFWAAEAWGGYWSWDPKETWALIVWLNYAAWLHMRLMKGLRGHAAAWWSLGGLVVTTFAFLGVNMFLSGLHSYGTL
ncbi:MAG: c-type cytochrome biogenesis protein CcsB [Burkholderiales bacterium]|nr:c-type cytochrome biogenesis protein CcsB [Burkholderiales bacterium]